MADKRNILKLLLLCLIAATLIFIFVQSMLPPESSSAESDAVGDIIEEIIPPETPAGSYIQINLRKIAHFVEFALLGIEVSLYASLYIRKRSIMLISYPVALITALIDESIQMISGRGPAIVDVWLDFSGFVSLSLPVYLAFFSVRYFKNRSSTEKVTDENGKNN